MGRTGCGIEVSRTVGVAYWNRGEQDCVCMRVGVALWKGVEWCLFNRSARRISWLIASVIN